MNKICTSQEQSKKLIKLGIDINTADMFWLTTDKPRLHVLTEDLEKYSRWDCMPAWSLTALLDLMPERIKIGEELSFCLTSKKSLTGFSFGYNLNESIFVKDNPVDAAFEMVCWLKENGKMSAIQLN